MGSSAVSIREFRFAEDYETVYQLWQNSAPGIQLRRSDEPSELKKKHMRDSDLFLVAEVRGRIIGSVLGGFDGRRGMAYHLAVAQEFRKQGIGNMLMSALEQRLREKGCIRYYLLVTKDNQSAIAFYEQLGWQKMDLHAYGKDLV